MWLLVVVVHVVVGGGGVDGGSDGGGGLREKQRHLTSWHNTTYSVIRRLHSSSRQAWAVLRLVPLLEQEVIQVRCNPVHWCTFASTRAETVGKGHSQPF